MLNFMHMFTVFTLLKTAKVYNKEMKEKLNSMKIHLDRKPSYQKGILRAVQKLLALTSAQAPSSTLAVRWEKAASKARWQHYDTPRLRVKQ